MSSETDPTGAPGKRGDRLFKYAQVLMLSSAATFIYSAPYLRQIFKSPLMDVFQLTEAQLGNLSSTYGIACILCYLPGGWLADRVSPRRLVITSLLAGAVTFVWMATIPGYTSLLVIYAAWGVIGILVLWSAMLRQVRVIGDESEQGRLFGLLEGSRGLFEAALFTLAALLFGWFTAQAIGMSAVFGLYAVLSAGLGLGLLWGSQGDGTDGDESAAITLSDVLLIVREPTVWLMCVMLTAVFHLFWAIIEFPSFGERAGFGMTVAATLAMGTARVWMRPVGGVLGGIVGDRVTNARAVLWLLAVGAGVCVFLALMDTSSDSVWILWALVLPFGILVYAVRGLIWAVLQDCPIPTYLTGSAIGFISIMGYSSDIYIPQVSSYLIGTYADTAGYQLFFAYVAVAAMIGVGATWRLLRLRVSSELE